MSKEGKAVQDICNWVTKHHDESNDDILSVPTFDKIGDVLVFTMTNNGFISTVGVYVMLGNLYAERTFPSQVAANDYYSGVLSKVKTEANLEQSLRDDGCVFGPISDFLSDDGADLH